MLGKRERNAAVVSREISHDDDSDSTETGSLFDVQNVFKQHFEAQFEPLPGIALSTPSANHLDKDDSGEEEDSDGSAWDGLSDAAITVTTVEVMEHGVAIEAEEPIHDNAEVKTFMSTRPPPATARLLKVNTQPKTKDDEVESVNLKNDLDLQRLLQESSLLKKAQKSSKTDRHRTTDLRLQSLGLKTSLYSQGKMPMAHRQGIKAKATSREDHRRRDARENGVVLEKAPRKGGGDKPKRERGVDAPGVGKFRGGTLKLSRRDIADIQGPKQIRGVKRR